MSGIVGILHHDKQPVDRDLLSAMAGYLTFCGPDQQALWLGDGVGFGHALLRTTWEAANEDQPYGLDGRLWITADARVDGRQELVGKLQAKGCAVTLANPDAELILYAYSVWGAGCLNHLIGDFAFAIWDEAQQQLFCARDHWGVRPFFYAQSDQGLIFSNILDCVRTHPAVTDDLDEAFIGDFLLFDASQDLAATAFAAIRRLPPAHYLLCTAGHVTLHRYWSLSPEIPLIHYKRSQEYVDHFQELLQTAVNDRLRTNNVTVMMSGGLDSSMVAATAKRLLTQQSTSFSLQAHTAVYDRLIPDQERYYAGIVAKALDIPIHYLVADDYKPYERWEDSDLRQPEPTHAPQLVIDIDIFQRMAQQSRVALTGCDGDTILVESIRPHFRELRRKRAWGQTLTDWGQFAWSQRWLQPLRYRRHLLPWRARIFTALTYPVWLNQELARHLRLHERWEEVTFANRITHPTRPYAYGALHQPLWTQAMECYAPNATQLPLEVRHPLADLRLVQYALALPVIPWLVHKHLQRIVARTMLPTLIYQRPKTPLAGQPLVERLREQQANWLDLLTPSPLLTRFIEPKALPTVARETDSTRLWTNLRPHSLNYWLQSRSSVNNEFKQEKKYNEYKQTNRRTARKTDQKSLSDPAVAGLWHHS